MKIIMSLLDTYIGTILSIKSIINLTCYKTKYTKKTYILLIIIAIILYINNMYNINFLKMIVTFITMLVSVKLITKLQLKDLFFYTVIFMILSIVIEILMSLILFNNIKNLDVLNSLVYFKMGITLLYSILIYYITKSKSINNILIKIKNIINNKFNFYVFALLIIVILMIIMNIRANTFEQTFYILYEILCLLFIFISISSIIKDKNNISLLNDINKQDLQNPEINIAANDKV